MANRLRVEESPVSLMVVHGLDEHFESLDGHHALDTLARAAQPFSAGGFVHSMSVGPIRRYWQVVAYQEWTDATTGPVPLRTLSFVPQGDDPSELSGGEASVAIFDSAMTLDYFQLQVERWLTELLPPEESERPHYELAASVEAFYTAWNAFTNETELAGEDRRTGDALARMATEVVKDANPPKSVLRETFGWFAAKADLFATEFVKGAGKTTGAAFGVGLGATASGQLPNLVKAIEAVRSLLA